MPYLTDSEPTKQLFHQARSLLQVLEQLAPAHKLAVALPNGQVLVSNTTPVTQAASGIRLQAYQFLGISEDEFKQLVQQLSYQKELSGVASEPNSHTGIVTGYTCSLLQYQETSFLFLKLTGASNPLPSMFFGEDSYQSVFEESTESLFILDKDGCFIDINRNALNLVQKPKEALLHQSVLRSFGLNLFERVSLNNQLQLAIAGKPQKFEWWLHKNNNELIPVEITLQQGNFQMQKVILGSAKNLNDVIDQEQHVRFRNKQLEFINQLLTNISCTESEEAVLASTLEELIKQSNVTGGCVYRHITASAQLHLTSKAGKPAPNAAPETVYLPTETAQQLAGTQQRKALADMTRLLQDQFGSNLTLVPITNDQKLLALIVLWPAEPSQVPQSCVGVLNFI